MTTHRRLDGHKVGVEVQGVGWQLLAKEWRQQERGKELLATIDDF